MRTILCVLAFSLSGCASLESIMASIGFIPEGSKEPVTLGIGAKFRDTEHKAKEGK